MSLKSLHHGGGCALYQLPGDEIRELVCSTPATRAICNDPFVCGVEYTQRLRAACGRVFQLLTMRRLWEFDDSRVVYLEGVFQTATVDTAMSIKIEGTDLLRTGGTLAPEFLESQYESPSFPVERCTIYDAGSRAFDLTEYFADVRGYWQANLALAAGGMTYARLLRERMPELDAQRFGDVDLAALARAQLAKIPAELPVVAPHAE